MLTRSRSLVARGVQSVKGGGSIREGKEGKEGTGAGVQSGRSLSLQKGEDRQRTTTCEALIVDVGHSVDALPENSHSHIQGTASHPVHRLATELHDQGATLALGGVGVEGIVEPDDGISSPPVQSAPPQFPQTLLLPVLDGPFWDFDGNVLGGFLGRGRGLVHGEPHAGIAARAERGDDAVARGGRAGSVAREPDEVVVEERLDPSGRGPEVVRAIRAVGGVGAGTVRGAGGTLASCLLGLLGRLVVGRWRVWWRCHIRGPLLAVGLAQWGAVLVCHSWRLRTMFSGQVDAG